jgi:hypothetical protein
MLELTFQRYFDSGSLMGDVDHCGEVVEGLGAAGVDEVACLVDFGVSASDLLASLRQVTVLAGLLHG